MTDTIDLASLDTDPGLLRFVLNGSCVDGPSFETWRRARSFIASEIHRPGTVLDIGCANGFLLRCLLEWSDHALTPFGIDSSADRARDVARFFPSQGDHFARLPAERLGEIDAQGLPGKYDFVYWAVWDNFAFDRQDRIDLLRRAYDSVKDDGRLILGFYDREPKTIENKIARIQDLNLGHAVRVANPDGPQELLRISK
ncbi:MAG: methyltransferase domain-containing protein [Gemmatimonadota bacterium]|nr:methyltransferase domain-containing protein [Gemmatimonadota bacterium]